MNTLRTAPRAAAYGAWLALVIASFATGARAQVTRVLLLPTGGEEALRAERAAVERALADALQRQRVEVLHADVAAKSLPAVRACVVADCAAALLPDLNADLAVSSAVWAPEQVGDERAAVSVMLVDRSGERFPGDAAIDGSAAAAAERALLAAQSLVLLGPGPWLEVSAAQQGGALYIDGERAGSLPYRGAVTAGKHALRVEAAGQPPWARDVDIPLRAQRVVTVRVDFAAASAEAAAEALAVSPAVASRAEAPGSAAYTDALAPRSQPSVWNYVLGSALVVSGGALLVGPARTLAERDECRGELDTQGRCGARVRAGTRTFVQLSAAGALLFGGAAVMLVRPLRIAFEADPEHARAQLSFDF